MRFIFMYWLAGPNSIDNQETVRKRYDHLMRPWKMNTTVHTFPFSWHKPAAQKNRGALYNYARGIEQRNGRLYWNDLVYMIFLNYAWDIFANSYDAHSYSKVNADFKKCIYKQENLCIQESLLFQKLGRLTAMARMVKSCLSEFSQETETSGDDR